VSTLSSAPTVSRAIAIRRFASHFGEMCIAMCAGGIVLNIVMFGMAGLLGFPDLVRDAPELSILLVAADLAIAMAIYMAVRGHPVRHNVEMSGITVVGALPLIGMYWLGLIPAAKFDSWPALFAFMCGPLCLLMLVAMLVRFEHYGGRVGASAIGAPASAGDYTCSMHPEVRLAEAGRCPICGMTLVRRS
jgi:hypothetical protein